MLHKLLRIVVFAALIIALAEPVMVTNAGRAHHIIVLDQSASLTAESRTTARTAALRLAQKAGDNDAVTLIALGADDVQELDDDVIRLRNDVNSSSIGRVLETAASYIPLGANGSVTLISDGLSTDRHWGRALQQLRERNIPVHSYSIREDSADIFPAGIEVAPARVGEAVRVSVTVVGSGSDLSVSLSSDDGTLVESGPFDSDGRRLVVMEFEAKAAGFLELTAELSASPEQDENADNNSLRTVIAIQDPLRLLYLTDRQQGGSARLASLLGPGFDVRERPADGDLAVPGLEPFDLVMLDDVVASSIPAAVQEKIVAEVTSAGLGLLHSGGGAAFGAGGYHDSKLADLLPVKITQKEDKSDPSVALAIIIDTSGSMEGTRIDLARDLARIAVRRLQPQDRIGIVEFYGAKHWAVPMQPATNKIDIERAIGRMKAVGGTVMYPAVVEAYYGIKNVDTRFRHILIITDAGVEDQQYERMVRRIAKDGINLSTVLVGQSGHDLTMSNLANWGRGRFYAVADPFNLVELILKQPSTRKPPAYKRGVFESQALGGEGWWGAVDPARLPDLSGYVEVRSREDAETLLEEKRSRHPLLSTWQFGQGRVTALMTEPLGAGTAGWQSWEDYGKWLGRIVARTASDQAAFALSAKRRGTQVTLSARRLERDPGLTPVAYLADMAGQRLTESEIAFVERAPGHFEAMLDVDAGEDARFVLTGGSKTQRIVNAALSDVAGETQVDPHKALDLDELSGTTNGNVLTRTGSTEWSLDAGTGEFSLVAIRLWPYLLLLSLLGYLAELLYRRWPKTTR